MPTSLNPLSCARCKAKKIRCGKQEPICDKCQASHSQCSYSARRTRTRRSKGRAEILKEILKRLEMLEQKVGGSADARSPPATELDDIDISSSDDELDATEGDEDDGSKAETNTPITSLYRMVNEATHTTADAFQSRSLGDEEAESDEAVSALSSAVIDIRNFRLRGSKVKQPSTDWTLPKELAKSWMQNALTRMPNDLFFGIVDKKLMMEMPDLIGLPYVHFDHSVLIVYHALMYSGWGIANNAVSPEVRAYGTQLYKQCLSLVPIWRKDGKLDPMDLVAADILCWTAIYNFDHQLSWKFHVEASKIAIALNAHLIDSPDTSLHPSLQKLCDNDAHVNSMRRGIWQLIYTDYMYQLCYEKPPTITRVDIKVNLPSLDNDQSRNELPVSSIIFLVSCKVTVILQQFFSAVKIGGDHLKAEVARLCDELEAQLAGWKLLEWLEKSDGDSYTRWYYADIITMGYTSIILMDRKANPVEDLKTDVSSRAVDAARRTMHATVVVCSTNEQRMNLSSMSYLAFYPFIAFFTIYHHVLHQLHGLGEEDVSESVKQAVSDDVSMMKSVEDVLLRLSKDQGDFRPMLNAATALNKVVHHLYKRSDMTTPLTVVLTPGTRSSICNTSGQSSMDDLISSGSHASTPHAIAGTRSPMTAALKSQINWRDGLQSPMGYGRAIENDLFNRNEHEEWWTMQG